MSRRLLATYISLALVVLAALEVPLGITFSRTERRDLEARLARDALALASIAEDGLERTPAAVSAELRRTARAYRADTGARVVVVDRRGLSLLDTDPPAAGRRDFSTRPELAAALRGSIVAGTRSSRTLGTRLLYLAVPAASGGRVHGAVRITYPTSALDARVRRYWLLLAAIGAVVLLVAAALAVAFARWLARPLARLDAAAAAAAAGDLTARAPLGEGPPEVREVAATFNELVARVDQLLRSQQEFIADASHQLRTPLHALRLRLENLERDVAEAGRPGLEGALAEVERLTRIVGGLLALARADAGRAAPQALDLAVVVDGRVDAWGASAEAREVRLEAALPRPLAARATAGSVEQVLDNLISNALAVAPPGSVVRIEGARRGGVVELAVVDEGPGMSAEQRERAFDRFWRGGGAAGGTGLGLAIARRLARADGGELELRDARGGGLAAVLRLPAG